VSGDDPPQREQATSNIGARNGILIASERRVDPASQLSIFLVGLALLVAIFGLGMR
jgi:hypothetical protein